MKIMQLIPAILLLIMMNTRKDHSALGKKIAAKGKASCDSMYVGFYAHNTEDKTFNFSSYRFSFCPDHTIVAASSSDSITGTWTTDDKQTTLIVRFNNTTSPVGEMSADWRIVTKSTMNLDLERGTESDLWRLRFDKMTR